MTENRTTQNEKKKSTGFAIGAIIGGLIGAVAALFLTPKTGKELRQEVSTQATNLKDKTVDLSSTAIEKTSHVVENSTHMIEKVLPKKTPTLPMDDGTASAEGEEPIEFTNDENN